MASLFDKLFKTPEDLLSQLEVDINSVDFKEFPLRFNYGVSDFKKELLCKEYDSYDKSRPNDQLIIETVHIYHGYEGVEAGVFIFNTSSTPVELYNVNLALKDNKGDLVAIRTVDFKGLCRIEPKSSMFHEILFEDVFIKGEIKEFQVVITNLLGMKISYNEEMGIESFMDDSLPEETKEYLRERLYEVPSIRRGEIIIDPIVAMGDKESIVTMILIRNATNSNVSIHSIPIKIYMNKTIPIYLGNYSSQYKSIEVQENKGKLITVRIPNKYVYGSVINGNMYTLKIK